MKTLINTLLLALLLTSNTYAAEQYCASAYLNRESYYNENGGKEYKSLWLSMFDTEDMKKRMGFSDGAAISTVIVGGIIGAPILIPLDIIFYIFDSGTSSEVANTAGLFKDKASKEYRNSLNWLYWQLSLDINEQQLDGELNEILAATDLCTTKRDLALSEKGRKYMEGLNEFEFHSKYKDDRRKREGLYNDPENFTMATFKIVLEKSDLVAKIKDHLKQKGYKEARSQEPQY